jgi:chorismate mutase
MKKLFALRGATQCLNTVEDIVDKVTLMYEELLSANKLEENDIVSVIFSATNDLDAVNPCSALRKRGYAANLALFACAEPYCVNSLEKVIRVIIHCYLDECSVTRHVYRNGAEVLRPDRAGPPG